MVQFKKKQEKDLEYERVNKFFNDRIIMLNIKIINNFQKNRSLNYIMQLPLRLTQKGFFEVYSFFVKYFVVLEYLFYKNASNEFANSRTWFSFLTFYQVTY